MPLTSAEKQRRYREKLKLDPTKNSLEKEKRRKLNAKRKKISELSERDQRVKRKAWRLEKQLRRKKIVTVPLSPPASPEVPPVAAPARGRKLILKNRSKANRDNVILKRKIEELESKCSAQKKEINRLKKKDYRMKQKEKSKTDRTPESELTPNSKAERISRGPSFKARRALFEYHVLTNALVETYRRGDRSVKRSLSSVVSKSIVKKYKLQNALSHALGLANRKRQAREDNKKNKKYAESLHNFFLRDDISFPTSGKKETITRHKIKEQKRFLTQSMKQLHKMYNIENRQSISYATFIRNKPFYVLEPSIDTRDTCRCRLHENQSLMLKKLKALHISDTEDCHSLISKVVCDKKAYNCMYGFCKTCPSHTNLFEVPRVELENQISWKIWNVQKKVYEKPGSESRQVTFVAKIEVAGTTETLINNFISKLPRFKTHIFNISAQSTAFRQCKEIVTQCDYEGLLILDFSENYNCKLNAEIQSFHFGGSREQVTLHTSVAYAGSNIAKSFCTISASLAHGPAAIWAHLDPVLKQIAYEKPRIKTFHFFSDGPSTQYRQKANFWLICQNAKKYGFETVTWSFFESGHGKGEADGIGGSVKRTADRLVAQGHDIRNAEEMFDSLTKIESKVTFFQIKQADIDAVASTLPKDLKTLPGTQKIHMICSSTNQKVLFYKEVSCFCEKNKWLKNVFCYCHTKMQKFAFDTSINAVDATTVSAQTSVLPPALEVTADTLQVGTYVLLQITTKARKSVTYRYVAVCAGNCDKEDDEVLVTFLRILNGNNASQLFRVDEHDTSYVKLSDIIQTLEDPEMVLKGNRTYFKWNRQIPVFEQP